MLELCCKECGDYLGQVHIEDLKDGDVYQVPLCELCSERLHSEAWEDGYGAGCNEMRS